jgi:CubicO group peptidase (beta-lactamase class C family)
MTATLCATLVEAGSLRWDARICDLFPRARMEEGWAGATLGQLLRNRGAAPENLDAEGLWGRLWRHDGTPVEARRLLLEGVLLRPPQDPPGRRFRYSNAGFAIAGHMAETAEGVPWETLIGERLFGPIGIRDFGFGAPEGDAPWGHDAKGRPVKPGRGADNPAAIAPAGTAHMPIGEWAKFIRLHLEQDSLLSKESFAALHRPEEDYAMGWNVTTRSWGGGEVWTHAGSNTMWFCVAWLAPAKRFAVLAMCNRGGDSAASACDDAAALLVRRFAG